MSNKISAGYITLKLSLLKFLGQTFGLVVFIP